MRKYHRRGSPHAWKIAIWEEVIHLLVGFPVVIFGAVEDTVAAGSGRRAIAGGSSGYTGRGAGCIHLTSRVEAAGYWANGRARDLLILARDVLALDTSKPRNEGTCWCQMGSEQQRELFGVAQYSVKHLVGVGLRFLHDVRLEDSVYSTNQHANS